MIIHTSALKRKMKIVLVNVVFERVMIMNELCMHVDGVNFGWIMFNLMCIDVNEFV